MNSVREHVITYSLCGFCDSSLKAYTVVVYLLVETSSGHYIRFAAAKTRVSPLKTQTIPRLELLLALLLARLISSIAQALENEVQLSRPHCFTDSTAALFWIQGVEKSWKPFVQNLISEIRKLLPPDHWVHCSGRENTTDIPSRGLMAQELASSQLHVWMNGPDCLKDSKFTSSSEPQMHEERRVEMKIDKTEVAHGLLAARETSGIEQLLRCEDFSSLRRLLSVTAYVLKFCRILLRNFHSDTVTTAPTTLPELKLSG